MRVGINTVLYKLEIIAYTYLHGTGTGEKPVVVSLTAADSVARPVKPDTRHHDKFDQGDIGGFVALRFLYMENSKSQPRAVVGQYFKIKSVDTRKIEVFARVPPINKLKSGKFIGKRVIQQYIVGKQKSRRAFKLTEHRLCRVVTFPFGQKVFLSLDPESYVFFFHCSVN